MSCLLFPSICCHPYTHSLFLISSPLSSPEVNRLAGRLVWLPAYLLHHHHHHLLWRTWSSVFSLGFPQFGFLLSIVGGRSVLGYGYMVGWLVMVSLIGSTWCCSVVACYLIIYRIYLSFFFGSTLLLFLLPTTFCVSMGSYHRIIIVYIRAYYWLFLIITSI